MVRSLENVIKQCAENLGSTNFELNMKSIQTIDHLLSVIVKDCSPKLMEDLLLKSKILLGEGKVPSFVRHIASIQPKLL